MKTFGITLSEGSDITNLTVDSGENFPAEPSLGELFYLTSGQKGMYLFDGENWILNVLANNEILRSDGRVLKVRKDPKPGQFSSIFEACASLEGVATLEEQWLIDIGPGLYTEHEIVIPPFVHVSGFAEYAVYVRPFAEYHPCITLNHHSTLSFLNVWDATGTDQAAVRCWDATNVVVHKVCVLRASIGFDIKAVNADAAVYLEYCDTEQNFGIGVNIDSPSEVHHTYVNLENFYVYGSDTNPATGVHADGPNVHVNIQSFGMEGADGLGNAFRLCNGAHFDVKAGSIFGWDIGAYLENRGVPSVANFIGVAFADCTTWDLLSTHPENAGILSGTATRTKVNAVASPGFTSAFADVTNNEFIQTGDFYMGKTQENLTNVSDLIVETPPMGLLSGGVVQPTGGFGVVARAGVGYLRKDGVVTQVKWPDTPLTIAPGAAPYIYVNKNAIVQQSITFPDEATNVILARAQAGASSITALGSMAINIKSHSNLVENFLRQAVGPVYVSGSIVTENAETPRALDVSAGVAYYGTIARRPSAKVKPYLVDLHKSNGQVNTQVMVQQVPNNTIDDGTNLVPMPTGYFTKHGLYSSSEGIFQAYFLTHGQTAYATLEEAREAPLPIPRVTPDAVPVIASIITQQGNDHIVEIEDLRPMLMRPAKGGTASTSDHGELTGLQDDDHVQYMLANGGRAMAGDLDLSGNDIKNVGLIDGLAIDAHGSRHTPQGPDPIPTGPAVALSPTSVDSEGLSNFLARSDHTHRISGFQPFSGELSSLSNISTTGIMVHAEPDTWHSRTLTGAPGEIVITNGTGVAGDPTVGLATIGTPGTFNSVTTDAFGRVTAGSNVVDWTTLTGRPTTLAGYGITDAQPKTPMLTTMLASLVNVSNGIASISSTGSVVARTLIQPAAGLTITNASAITGNPTFALSNDLAAVEGLATFGIPVRTAADTWTTRSITGASGITVTNGNGVAGDPVISLSTVGTPGTYRSVTTDAFGRVTAGTNPTTLAGYGITDAQPLDADLTALANLTTTGLYANIGVGTAAARTITGTAGRVNVANGNGVSGNPTIDLPAIVTAGVYDSVTVDAYGRVIAGTEQQTSSSRQILVTSITGGTTTAIISTDNTQPTFSEGGVLATLSVTPRSNDSLFAGTITTWVDSSVSNRNITITVFRGTTFVGASSTNISAAGRPQALSLAFSDSPSTGSSVTYTVRAGISGTGTAYFNRSSAFTLGGNAKTAFILTEIL